MIRFRVGQRWKTEEAGPGGPRDAFALEVDGVNLLPGAKDEPLVRMLGNLVDAVTALVADGEQAGQISLEDVHLEVCFWRTAGVEVQVTVVDLGASPRQLRAPVTLELPALVEATVASVRAFLRDVAARRSGLESELTALERRLKGLTGLVIAPRTPRATAPWTAARGAEAGLGFTLRDAEGRALSWSRKSRAALPALLFPGEVQVPDAPPVRGHPFLILLGLARAATGGEARLEGRAVAPEQVFLAGLELCVALRAHAPALATNPYVEALQVRCVDGLTALRQPVPDLSPSTLAAARASPGPPLARRGEVRRVALQQRWTREVALGEEGGRLRLARSLVLVHSPHAVHAFDLRGRPRFRRLAARGVAVSAEGHVLCAIPDQLSFLPRGAPGPTWLRDHDGVPVGPTLEQVDHVLLAPMERSGMLGLDALTGRERWRFDPPRTQQSWATRLGGRVLLATDAGTLYGLDASDGQVRFRVKASLPARGAPVPMGGRQALVVLSRGEHTAVFLCAALSRGDATAAGDVRWTRELVLSAPCPPVTWRNRSWLGGERDGRGVVVALGPRGQVLWERAVPCDARSLRLVPWEGGVVATDAGGGAVRLLPDGAVDWALGASRDQLAHPIAPLLRRRVLVVPGPVTRLVDPREGRVLAEVETGGRMIDLAADPRLTLFVLRETGTLDAWAPSVALAVV